MIDGSIHWNVIHKQRNKLSPYNGFTERHIASRRAVIGVQ